MEDPVSVSSVFKDDVIEPASTLRGFSVICLNFVQQDRDLLFIPATPLQYRSDWGVAPLIDLGHRPG